MNIWISSGSQSDFLFLLYFRDGAGDSQYSSGCPRTCYISQIGLKFIEICFVSSKCWPSRCVAPQPPIVFCSCQPHPLQLLLQTSQISAALRNCLTVLSEVDLELMILLPWPLTTGIAVWFIIPSLGSWLFLTIPAPGMRVYDRGQSLVFYTYGWVQSTGHSACQSRHLVNIWWVNKIIFKLSFNNNKCIHLLFQFNHTNTILLVKMQHVGRRQEGTKTRKEEGRKGRKWRTWKKEKTGSAHPIIICKFLWD